MDHRFNLAEQEYARLRREFEAGRLSEQAFHDSLSELAVQDAGGRFWMLGANTGRWYFYDGRQWIESDPNPPIAPKIAPRAPQTTRRSRSYWVAFAVASLVCFIIAVLLLFSFLESPRRFTASAVGLDQAASSSVAAGKTIAELTPVPADGQNAPAADEPTTAPKLPGTPLPEDIPTVNPTAVPTHPPQVSNPVTTQGVIPTITPQGYRAPEAAQEAYPPGIYVTHIEVADKIQRGQAARFTARFVNTTGQTQRVQWQVVILDPGSNKELTQASPFAITVPNGKSRFWRSFVPLSGRGGCITLHAVAAYKQGNKLVFFQNTDGSTLAAEFQAC